MIGSRRPLKDNGNILSRPLTRNVVKNISNIKSTKNIHDTVLTTKPNQVLEFSVKRNSLRKHLIDSNAISLQDLNQDSCQADDDETMVASYALSIFDYMQDKEQSMLPIKENFISENSELTGRVRYITVDWMVVVWHKFKLSSDVLYLAVAIMDRFIQKTSEELNTNNIQRVAITCLHVASKFDEACCPALSDFAFVTEGSSSPRAIKIFEMSLLQTLDFQITLPLPIYFLKRYLHLDQSCDYVIQLSKYFLFLTVPEYDLCYLSGNVRSAAALCLANALVVTNSKDISKAWSSLLSWHSGLTVDDISTPIKILAKTVVRQNASSSFRAVQSVFSGSNYRHIARIPELSEDLIFSIAEVD